MSASLEVTFLLWFVFIVSIGFWSAKILLEGVVGEIVSRVRTYKFRKDACRYYKAMSDSFYEKAEAREEDCVAVARTTEDKKEVTVVKLNEKIDGLSCGTKGYKQLHEIVEKLCSEYEAKMGVNSDDYWLKEGKEIFIAAMTLYLFEQKPANERMAIRSTVYRLVNDPEVARNMQKFVEG